jgi:cold-inducible RNA-binding protein
MARILTRLERLSFLLFWINLMEIFMNKRLYVGGLPYSFDNKKLERLFSELGTVVSAKAINDKDTGRSRGFGFVEMGSAEEAQQAINRLNGSIQEGKTITVTEAKPERERTGGGRGNFIGAGNRNGEIGKG